MNKILMPLLVLCVVLCALPLYAQQSNQTVELQSTISGNQEQPKTIYILPWQSPVALIRVPGKPLEVQQAGVSPLDRQQFLRFIAVQSGTSQQPVSEQNESSNTQK